MLGLNLRGAALAALLLLPTPLAAGEIVAGAGLDDVRDDRHAAAGLEVRTGPLWSRSRFGLAFGAAFEVDNDFWAGAGPVILVTLTPRWRLEASVMLGSYVEGDGGDDLGADFPMFRSQLGASYALTDDWRIGAAIDHKSNARTAISNPGVETLFVTLARRF